MSKLNAPAAAGAHTVLVLVNDDTPTTSPTALADASVVLTGHKVVAALDQAGFRSAITCVASEADIAAAVAAAAPDVVFNLVESLDGDAGREWRARAVLERLGVATTGNGSKALRTAARKDRVARLLARRRIASAQSAVVTCADDLDRRVRHDGPYFVKPARADASIGITEDSYVADMASLRRQIALRQQRELGPWLVDRWLPGAEFSVSFVPGPRRGRAYVARMEYGVLAPGVHPILTYASKWTDDAPTSAAHSVWADVSLPRRLRLRIAAVARRAFLAVGGDGYGRVDVRLDARGCPCVIDINPNPDLDPEAGLSRTLGAAGVPWPMLLRAILAQAYDARRPPNSIPWPP